MSEEKKQSKRSRKKVVSRAKYKPKSDTSVVQKRAKKYLSIVNAKKNIRKNHSRRLINRSRISRVKTYIKRVLLMIQSNNYDKAKDAFKDAQSQIMMARGKGLIKLNKASRMVKGLNLKVKSIFQK